MHSKSVCLLLAVLHVTVSAISIQMELLKDEKDACYKYTKKGAEFLMVTHARILNLGADGTIIGNVLCDFSKKKTLKTACSGVGDTKAGGNLVLLLSVTARKEMMLSQVEYRYKESSMQLSKLLDMDKLKDQQFDHEVHIQVKRIKIDGIGNFDVRLGSCHDAYPGSLIADHGLYASRWDGKNKNIQWNRVYFDPDGLGEKFLTD
ncbi:unnamed protein product [Caenorhabditis sp. 36 PRJEB53466]|nr:unnamed protein product [Caenorhabditis sp. 36 PRJEB53466]